MKIKLFQPSAGNWLLIAEGLSDPDTWDRFVPTHTPDSERAQFDRIATESAADHAKLRVYKNMLKRGTSAFEYDWEVDEDSILSHAIRVAETLGVSLDLEQATKKSA